VKALAALALASLAPWTVRLPELVPAGAARAADSAVQVSVEEGELGQLCTIRARKAPVDHVMAAIANELELRLTGFEGVTRAALVDVHLEKRPIYPALEAILGSVGLRADLRPGLLAVVPNKSEPDAPRLLDRALALYLGATSRFPDHPANAAARLQQGTIEEERGNLDAALVHFEALAENFRASELVPRAMYESGHVLERMELWDDAARRYQTLAGRSDAGRLASKARLGLARCALAQQDYSRAIQLVASLDASYPASEDGERTERLLLRARALCHSGMNQTALGLLDRAERIGMEPEGRREALELRALAFEGLELLGEASRAWLVFANEVGGEQRALALADAARLSLADGDELGTLFVCEEAARTGQLDEGLSAAAREARLRLGLDIRNQTGSGSVEDRLATAGQLLDTGRTTEALGILEPLYKDRLGLDETSRVHVVTALAAGLDATRGLDPAIAVLGGERGSIERLENRRLLDRRAAELFERHGRFDEAVEAYRGRY
jgi:tetratricopeptide (TPR) repeat protein